jgi:pyruvate dehydrogenase phosphatase
VRLLKGTWEPSNIPGRSGKWRMENLSEDQTGRNEKEVARIKKEHPPDEESTVIVNGRVLGNLEPTRAFGDSRYKVR